MTALSSTSLFILPCSSPSPKPEFVQASLIREPFVFQMMNSFLRGNEADLENRLSELLLDRRLVICYFGFMVIFLFVVEQFAPSMLVFVVVGLFLVPIILFMCYNYQRRRGEVHAAVLNESTVHTDQQVQMHSFVTRPNLPAIRTQLAHLDQGFDREDDDVLSMMG